MNENPRVRIFATTSRSASPSKELWHDDVVRHDATLRWRRWARALSRSPEIAATAPTPVRIFRQVNRPAYDDLTRDQVRQSVEARGAGDLQPLIDGSDHWTVS